MPPFLRYCRFFTVLVALLAITCAEAVSAHNGIGSSDTININNTVSDYSFEQILSQLPDELSQQVRDHAQVRQQIIQRAEDYIQHSLEIQGQVVPTAFVVEGLLRFGFAEDDPYIAPKIRWLEAMVASDGQVYDEYGYRLHSETSYIHRMLEQREISRRQPGNSVALERAEPFNSPLVEVELDERLFTDSAETIEILSEFEDSVEAIEFLQDGFLASTPAMERTTILPRSWENPQTFDILAGWSAGSMLNRYELDSTATDQLLAYVHNYNQAVISTVNGTTAVNIGRTATVRICVESETIAKAEIRPEGYFLLGRTVVLNL